MHHLKYLACSLMVFIVLCCGHSNGQDCHSLYKKRGCYKWIGGYSKQLSHLLLYDRMHIDWKDYHGYLQRLICRCAKKAAQEGYKSIGIQFWGECWGTKNAISEDKLVRHVNCANGTYKTCREEDFICSGKAYTTHVYDIDECAAGKANCDENANCVNSPGSFSCQCRNGYVGSGFTCKKSNDMFSQYDTNSDGKIDIDELKKILERDGEDLREPELEAMFKRTDKDGNGFIDREEFSQMMDNKVNETRQNFNLFDKDGSGFLDRNEVKVALESMGDQVTDDEVNGILQQGDVDRDGKISYDEFVKAWLMMS